MIQLALLAAFAVALLLWMRHDPPRLEVHLHAGQAHLVRGQPPPGLLHGLREVAEQNPGAEGVVRVHGSGPDLRVAVSGLDEGAAQRARNAVYLLRDRL